MNYSEAFCNAEYNPRPAVANHLAIMEGWKNKSMIARTQSECLIDLTYGPDIDERVDVFLTKKSNAPCLIFIHGGYWRASDKSEFSFIAKAIADAGANVFVVNYGLAPRVTLETIIQQIHRATQWVFEHAQDYGANPQELYLSGHSAGGHMTAMMLCSSWKTQPNLKIKGGFSISGLYDLEPLIYASFLNPILQLDLVSAKAMSPIHQQLKPEIPFWTCVGGDESSEFHRQNQLIATTWLDSFRGDIAMPHHNHFSIMDAMADTSTPLFQGIIKMLRL